MELHGGDAVSFASKRNHPLSHGQVGGHQIAPHNCNVSQDGVIMPLMSEQGSLVPGNKPVTCVPGRHGAARRLVPTVEGVHEGPAATRRLPTGSAVKRQWLK